MIDLLPCTISNAQSKVILLVEDNQDDVDLTLSAFKKCHIYERGGDSKEWS